MVCVYVWGGGAVWLEYGEKKKKKKSWSLDSSGFSILPYNRKQNEH